MNVFDEISEPVSEATHGRKRGVSKETHQKEITKRQRHSGAGKVPRLGCVHEAGDGNSACCQSSQLTDGDILLNFEKFYGLPSKVAQEEFLLPLLTVVPAKRKRVSDANRRGSRDFTVRYELLRSSTPNRIQVCKATFISVFCITKDRVTRLVKFYADNGTPRPERRGGARKKEEYDAKKQLIIDHIKSFTCRASHYARRGALGRKYLPSDLSVKKMHELFMEQNHQQISYSMYWSVFSYHFNLAFGHPAKDICATCVKYKLKMKDRNLSDEEKQIQAAHFLLHRRRVRSFYDLMNNVDGSVTLCFDMMENMVLPKTPVGQSYYSRQLYLYLFAVVVHRGKDAHQSKDDIHLFVWGEHENRKDSNMIAAALSHTLTNPLRTLLSEAQLLRLFSDSYYGHNKNDVLSMLFSLKSQYFPRLKIEYTFPMRGHSFLPADRVFGRIEQELKKMEQVLLPEEYISALRNHGTVYVYGKDWFPYDYKSATASHVKTQRSFKMSEAKVLQINGDKLGFKAQYNGEFCEHTILKRGKTWATYKPNQLENCSTVKAAKKGDVEKLLEEIGAPENVSQFYAEALSATNDTNNDESSDED